MNGMEALKAHVKNGRLVLDEPTDLQEGSVVPLEIADDWDELDDEERERLHQALDQAISSAQAGRTVDGDEVIRRLLSRP
jgi:hypothetical protein